jgi:hypothetical protein
MQALWASEWSMNERSLVKTLYILPEIVPTISSFSSRLKLMDIILLSSWASWERVHDPYARFTFLSFPSPPPTYKWSWPSAAQWMPLELIGMLAL